MIQTCIKTARQEQEQARGKRYFKPNYTLVKVHEQLNKSPKYFLPIEKSCCYDEKHVILLIYNSFVYLYLYVFANKIIILGFFIICIFECKSYIKWRSFLSSSWVSCSRWLTTNSLLWLNVASHTSHLPAPPQTNTFLKKESLLYLNIA